MASYIMGAVFGLGVIVLFLFLSKKAEKERVEALRRAEASTKKEIESLQAQLKRFRTLLQEEFEGSLFSVKEVQKWVADLREAEEKLLIVGLWYGRHAGETDAPHAYDAIKKALQGCEAARRIMFDVKWQYDLVLYKSKARSI